MKIEDRIQALKRSAKYRRDYERYDAYRKKNNILDSYLFDYLTPVCKISREGQKLCSKYKIPFPFNPDGEVVLLPGKQIVPAEQVIKVPSVTPMPIRKTKDGEQVFGLVDKRYLRISVDISRPKKEVFQELAKLYRHYKEQIGDKKRIKSSSLNCWDIYDKTKLHKKRNLLSIAKAIYGFKENPAYCEEARNRYVQITRAYEKAERLIRELEVESCNK